ncbi:hypothetical protein ACVWZA_002472 [Sphingomonas sp. UYAg733]
MPNAIAAITLGIAMLAPQLAVPIMKKPTQAASPTRPARTTATTVRVRVPAVVPRSRPTPSRPLGTVPLVDGFKPKPPVKVLTPAERTPMITPEQARHRRVLEACNRSNGQWYVKVRGIDLSAGGTDVDEIYGRIWVSSTATDSSQFSSSAKRTGWNKQTLWGSEESVNLGKYPETALATVTIPGDGRWAGRDIQTRVHFELRDEDGGRGGSDDEFFYFQGNEISMGYANYRIFPVHIPTCEEGPEFERTTQVKLTARASGSASGNFVSLLVNVRTFRRYD